MKLNEQQVLFRHVFRQHVLSMWGQGKTMFDVIIATAISCNITTKDAWSIAESVPSIGRIDGKTRIDVWVGHSYPKVSEALFNKDRRAAETLFIAKNHQPISKIRSEKTAAIRQDKQLKELRKLNSEKGDRWAKTSWNICK